MNTLVFQEVMVKINFFYEGGLGVEVKGGVLSKKNSKIVKGIVVEEAVECCKQKVNCKGKVGGQYE